LDETVENRKGASSGTIEALPTQTVPAGGLPGAAAGERLSCAVCLEEFVEGSELRCLPCLHKFHKVCLVAVWCGC
jgi:E3 ubiquitin-protein ligase RLIM